MTRGRPKCEFALIYFRYVSPAPRISASANVGTADTKELCYGLHMLKQIEVMLCTEYVSLDTEIDATIDTDS